MLIDNIDRLFNTAGIIAVAVKTTGIDGSDDIAIRNPRDGEWGSVLRAAIALHVEAGEERLRIIVGMHTIFTQSEGGQVAAALIRSADAFIKSVHRTIHRMGKDGRQRHAVRQADDEQAAAPAIAHEMVGLPSREEG